MAAKTYDGTYIGTVKGSPEQKQALAKQLANLLDTIDRRIGREGIYSQVSLQVDIKDGKIKSAVVTTSDSEIAR